MKSILLNMIALGGMCAMASSVKAENAQSLIPRQVLFGNPDKAQARISPDGTRISFLAPVNGVLNIWVGPADKPQEATPITNDTKRGIHIHYWAYTNHHILYEQDKEGDENWHIYIVDLTSGLVRDLTPLEGVQARIQAVSHLHPQDILVGLNDRNRQFHDIYRINLDTGERNLLFQNDSYAGVMADDNYQVRAGFSFNPEGGLVGVKFAPDGKPEPLITIGPEDVIMTQPLDFDKSGKRLYLRDSRERNTAALRVMDLDTGKTTLVAEDARVDIGQVMFHPTEKNPQAYSTYYERRQWHPLDKAVAKDLEALRAVADGDLLVVSRTLDDGVWIVAFDMDNGPIRYYRYDRSSRKATFLFSDRRELEALTLARMHPEIIKGRDGLNLVSYLTLPTGAKTDGAGRPASPLPLVLWVHGGPWSRDTWGYNPIHQWLANRGYAVLSVNFRASIGFGKNFINAANREWGGKMHDDLIDAVNWAIKEDIADPARVAIMGGSYGGYATLVGMTRTPDLFACGVDLVGISNLITWLNNLPEYWIPMLPLLKDRVGDHTTEAGKAFLVERSPLTHAGEIKNPLLIGQGANDPRVPPRESDQIVKAMQEHKIPVAYVIYSDEGHGFLRPENSISFWAVAEAFLSRHLGGRFQPIGEDFKGSTIQIPTGLEQIPGGAEALAKEPKAK